MRHVDPVVDRPEGPGRLAPGGDPARQLVERSTRRASRGTRTVAHRLLVPVVVLVVLILVPWMSFGVPGVFSGAVNTPGSLTMLALCLVFAGIALSYDVLFGHVGLLSFGHAMFVGAGGYSAAIVMNDHGFSLAVAVLVAGGVGVALSLLVGVIALRVTGIAFSMVMLAAAQAMLVLFINDPMNVTGGDEGIVLDRSRIPAALVGLVNAPNRYWLALAFCTIVWMTVEYLRRARIGHAWAAVRENEGRVEALGVSAFKAKLGAVVIGGLFGSLGGVIHLVITGGATPATLGTSFTLSLLIMVVIGGAGSRFGAIMGAFVYVILDQRLPQLAQSDAVAGLPEVLRVPLSQPIFILGSVFVLLVYFAPGGFSRMGARISARRRRVPATSGI